VYYIHTYEHHSHGVNVAQFYIPIAILIGSLLISATILYSNRHKPANHTGKLNHIDTNISPFEQIRPATVYNTDTYEQEQKEQQFKDEMAEMN
jgi:hypothetical protein